MPDFKDLNNVVLAGGVTGERDVITSPSLWRWTMEGKVFEAGYGLEDTHVDSEGSATVDDTTATFTLQSPSASALLVVPIVFRLSIYDEGGAVSFFQIMFTKPAALCATALALSSGTALTSKHCLYRTNPAQTAQQSTTYSTVTVSAMATAADFVSYHRSVMADNTLVDVLPAMGTGPSNVSSWYFLEEGAPHIMTGGAAMLVYCYNASGDQGYHCYMQWAELTEDDLY